MYFVELERRRLFAVMATLQMIVVGRLAMRTLRFELTNPIVIEQQHISPKKTKKN
jgi:hypothetical protein